MTASDFDQSIAELFPKVAGGDRAARDAMIATCECLVRDAIYKSFWKYKKHRTIRDELFGCGILKLTEIIDGISQGRYLNGDRQKPGAYLRIVVKNAVADAGLNSELISATRRLRGKSFESRFQSGQAPIFSRRSTIGRDEIDPSTVRPAGWNLPSVLEIREELDICCEDDRDRNIIDLLSQDFTFEEIAKRLQIGTTTVGRRLQGIRLRYQERNNDT